MTGLPLNSTSWKPQVFADSADGVQAAFWEDPRVLTVSIHQTPLTLWPGTGFPEETGDPATALGSAGEADYALFIHGAGSYSSGGRVAVMVGAIPIGCSALYSSVCSSTG